MIKIDFDALNPLEKRIHNVLSQHHETAAPVRIKEAAKLCGCSESKISKFAKKLGFNGYKQYLDFLTGKTPSPQQHPSELDRLRDYLDEFDSSIVDEMVKLIGSHKKLILLGTGPSFQCAQYFEYRLRTCTDIVAIAAQDDFLAASMADKDTLLLIFTVTGAFRSYEEIYRDTKRKGGDVVLVLEEYDTALMQHYEKVICLGLTAQPDELRPYEKTRTSFFILMEEVIRELMVGRAATR